MYLLMDGSNSGQKLFAIIVTIMVTASIAILGGFPCLEDGHAYSCCEPLTSAQATTYSYSITPGVDCYDFHVEVRDHQAGNYTNVVAPEGWNFKVHKAADGEGIEKWWASWWEPTKTRPIAAGGTFIFKFDNPNVAKGDQFSKGTDTGRDDPADPMIWGTSASVVPHRPTVVCEGEGIPAHPPNYRYLVNPAKEDMYSFHVCVGDQNGAHYTNILKPAGWEFRVHKVQEGDWWASWWAPEGVDPVGTDLAGPVTFGFDNPTKSQYEWWIATRIRSDNPYPEGIDVDGWCNYPDHPDGKGKMVHTPSGAPVARRGKAGVHVAPHGSRSCTKNFPIISGCGDINTTEASPDADCFPVFFELEEYQGFDYGMTWPGMYTCVFTSCSDLTIGSIVSPGDGISHAWTECHAEPVAVTGWGWIYDYGMVCIVSHPAVGTINIGDCTGNLYEPFCVFCAGIGGYIGDDPCEPTTTRATTWGEIKSMFK